MGGMTHAELAELDHDLARGPCLIQGAVFGACVGALIGWFKGSHGADFFENVSQGAISGVGVNLGQYAFSQWVSRSERQGLSAHVGAPGGYLAGIAPYPLYRQSLSYPWSSH